MDFLERHEEGQNKLQLLHSLRNRKEKLQKQLQALRGITFDLDQNADRVGETEQSHHFDSLLDAMETYRLLGVSISTTDAGLTLRFDALYESQFPSSECHYMQLIKKEDNYVVGKYNIPPFVPLKQVEEKYLGSSLAVFASEIGNYLYAYVQRREGLRKVQEEFSASSVGQLVVNLPVTFVNMRVRVGKGIPDVEVKLHYDLLKCLPDSIHVLYVKNTGSSSERLPTLAKRNKFLARWKACLAEMDIYSAVSKLLGQNVAK